MFLEGFTNDNKRSQKNDDNTVVELSGMGNENLSEICHNQIIVDNEKTSCTNCELIMHYNCGVLFEEDILCPLCLRGKNLIDTRNDCFKRQKFAAEKMVNISENRFLPLDVGDCITLSVPKEHCGSLDFRNICGVIIKFENGVYQIGTKDGLLKGWYPRSDIGKTKNIISINDVPLETLITLREAAAKQSFTGGQGFKKCKCQPAKTQC